MTIQQLIEYLVSLPPEQKNLPIYRGMYFQSTGAIVEVLTVKEKKIAILKIT